MEYCAGGSVVDLVKGLSGTVSEELIATILYQTLKGTIYPILRHRLHAHSQKNS